MKRDFRHGFDVSADYCGTKQGEIQAGGEHPFRVVDDQSGRGKVRYKGPTMSTALSA